MLVKVNKEAEFKISHISKMSGMKKDLIMKEMIEAFIGRYETQRGKITPPAMQKRTSAVFTMYNIYKQHYFKNFNREYVTDIKTERIDMRNIKLLREKILRVAMEHEQTDVIAVDDQDLFNAFDFVLTKLPEWWVKNCFTTNGIYKNFEKIIGQIKNGRQSGKDALDDFISGLSR